MGTVVTFNGKTNLDIGTTINSIQIQPPAKKKVLDNVPGMNGEYDFSTVASGGEPIYNTREITIKFNLNGRTKEDLYALYTSILNWLIDVEQSELSFDFFPNYYFLAEVQTAPKFETALRLGTLDVTFTAEPFKYSNSLMGDDIWDTFCFLSDYTQYTNIFEVNGSATITMCNNGRIVTPTINCSAAMTVTFEGETYSLVAGDNIPYGLKLQNGENTLTFSGTGTAKIIFRWEAL